MGHHNSKIEVLYFNVTHHEKKLYQGTNTIKHNASHGEKIVGEFLLQKKKTFIPEFIHPNLHELRYDYLFRWKKKTFLLEFDGEQHFKRHCFNMSEEDFRQAQERDRIKTQLARVMNIPLIRIDYTQIASIPYHLRRALKSPKPLYLSTPSLYLYLKDPVMSATCNRYLKGFTQ